MDAISASDVDGVVSGVLPPEEHAIASTFRAQATPEKADGPWLFLAAVFDIHLRPENPDDPFGPMLVMDGKRSMIPSDLDDAQVALLGELLTGVTAPAVRARIGDVLWVARRDGRAGKEAVPAYLALGSLLEDPDKWVQGMHCYERAIRLARSLGRNNPLLVAALQHLADRVEHYKGEDSSFFTSRALALLEEFRYGDAARLSQLALKAADQRRDAGDAYPARAYYEVGARLLNRAGLAEQAEQARIEAARTWVTEADAAEMAGNHIAAQSHLESAIQAYRAISKCKGLLPELHRRLNATGEEALKAMRQVSSNTIDIGPVMNAARERVVGRPQAEAVYALASIAPTLDPQRVREQVLEAAEKAPLSSMFSIAIYDRNGRVVHKHPGLQTSDPEQREQAIEALMCRHADMVRGLTAQAQVAPGLMALLGEHVVEEGDMLALLDGSILVPEGREGLFAMGLAAGFRRDMVTAMHLLVPQLEHALRTLLKAAGVITATIDQDGIQSDWPLGRLLTVHEMRQVLPETLIFELRGLLVYKGSTNIRNRLCHGLLSPDDFSTGNVLYLWWLLLKVSLHGTPGYQAWLDDLERQHAGSTEEEHGGHTEA